MNSTAIQVQNNSTRGLLSPSLKISSEVHHLKNLKYECGVETSPCHYTISNQSSLIEALNTAKISILLEQDKSPLQSYLSGSLSLDSKLSIFSQNTKTSKRPEKNIEHCLLPKKGTAKPRQSRKKMSAKKSNTAGKSNSKSRECYTGARVKETVREKLDRLRAKRKLSEHENEKLSCKRRSPYVTTPPRRVSTSVLPSYETTHQHSKLEYSFSGPGYTDKLLVKSSSKLTDTQAFVKFQKLLDKLDRGELTLISFTEKLNSIESLENIIFNDDGEGVLFYAAKRCLSAVEPSQLNNKNESVMITLCNRFSKSGINMQNGKGETPLHVAVSSQNIGAINGLLKNSADPGICDYLLGDTVFHRAVRTKNIRILNTLMIFIPRMGPSPIDFQNSHGNTPLHIACEMLQVSGGSCDISRRIATMLIDYSSSVNIPNNKGVTPYMIWSLYTGKNPQQREYRPINTSLNDEEYKSEFPTDFQTCSTSSYPSSSSPYYSTFPQSTYDVNSTPPLVQPSAPTQNQYRASLSTMSSTIHNPDFANNLTLPPPPSTYAEVNLPCQSSLQHQMSPTTSSYSYSFNNSNNSVQVILSPTHKTEPISPHSSVFEEASPHNSDTSPIPLVSLGEYQSVDLPSHIAGTSYNTLAATSTYENAMFSTYSGLLNSSYQESESTVATTSSSINHDNFYNSTPVTSSEHANQILDDFTELFCDDDM